MTNAWSFYNANTEDQIRSIWFVISVFLIDFNHYRTHFIAWLRHPFTIYIEIVSIIANSPSKKNGQGFICLINIQMAMFKIL